MLLLDPTSVDLLASAGVELGGAALGLREVAAVVGAYLLGSLPFGLLLGHLRGVDIRAVGSGNIGATNVGRALGRGWAVVAFACDFLKGWLPSSLAFHSRAEHAELLGVLCAGAAVCGHVWPIYLRFRGGKGVATGCGGIVGIDPVVFLVGGLVWLATLALARFVSLASLLMGLAFPVVAWVRMRGGHYGKEVVVGAAALTLLIWLRHRANIARIWSGTEPRIGKAR
jgi:glycerol-3-phosphate acyltransferase PlsY